MVEDGRCVLRFGRELAHSREKVWRALTEKQELRQWFVSILDYDRLEFEPSLGARLVFVSRAGDAGYGEVTACDPPRLLEYTWDGEILRWELTSTGDSSCSLVFTNVFDDPRMVAPLTEGWESGLVQLASFLDLSSQTAD